MYLKLPYLEDLDKHDEKIKYMTATIDYEDWFDDISTKLCYMNGNSRNRNDYYIDNFLASNALINGRIETINGKRFVVPNESDLKLFEWVMNVHSRFADGSLEGIVYQETIDYGFPVSVPILMGLNKIREVMDANGFLEMDTMNALQRCLDNLVMKGLMIQVRVKGTPTFDLTYRNMIVE